MKLSEPTTATTDYILAVELLLLGSLLAGSSSQRSVRLWAASFLVMAVAAIAGGTFHAGRFAFDASLLRALWKSVQICMALSFALLLAGVAVSTSAACLIQWLDNRCPAGTWILSGGLITGGAIAVQRAGATIHRRFNHNDLFHVLMMAAYYFLYRGGLLLRDQ